MRKKLLRLRYPFSYGGKWKFRARITDHGADQIAARSGADAPPTLLSFVGYICSRLESAAGLAELPKPKAGDSIIVWFDDTGEIVMLNFIPISKDPTRKEHADLDMVIETYLRRADRNSPRIRSSAHDTCIAVLDTGKAVLGKHNAWFI